MKRFTSLFLIFAILSSLGAQTIAPGGLMGSLSVDGKLLKIASTKVDIRIDNQHETVRIVQIFENTTSSPLEGQYTFDLPIDAAVSDFAVWEDGRRLPGVMMEKKRANETYERIKNSQIDPGLLQQDDGRGGSSAFSAKIFPISAHGTKRVELEYSQYVPVDELASQIIVPITPSKEDTLSIEELEIALSIRSEIPFKVNQNSTYPLKVVTQDPNLFKAVYKETNAQARDNFSISYGLDMPENQLKVTAYRKPSEFSVFDLSNPRHADINADGYFEAAAYLKSDDTEQTRRPLNLVLLLDNSLSMYGQRLSKSFAALELFISSLQTDDRFVVGLFNESVTTHSQTPVNATPENIENAFEFIKNGGLGGGTDLRSAVKTAFELTKGFHTDGRIDVLMITDANPTNGSIRIENMIPRGISSNIGFHFFAVGNDSNSSLIAEMAKQKGWTHEVVPETAAIEPVASRFLRRIIAANSSEAVFETDQTANIYDLYPINQKVWPGSSFAFVGRYRRPAKASFAVQTGGNRNRMSQTFELPGLDDTHTHLPRVWANARISHLVDKMNIHGETKAEINEVIALSRKYKIVTPYTSFIAAPRALLRPRLIQPGDPVIRVKTDSSIEEVYAVLPFGEMLRLRYLKNEGVWETRFLAPVSMNDGKYLCRILMRDDAGNGYEELKSFIIDSKSPTIRPQIESRVFAAGETIAIKALADSDTLKLIARMYGGTTTDLRWSDKEKTNIGSLRIPASLAPGTYTIRITAEDFARNHSFEEINIRVR